MNSSIIENKQEIQRQLFQLGFANVEEIIKSAQPLLTAQSSSITGIRLADPSTGHDSDRLGFFFDLDRIGNSDEWQIKFIRLGLDVKSDRSPNGRKPVDRYWHVNDGPLPHKERMTWITTRAAKIEAAKETFLSEANTNPDTAAITTGKISPLNKELEAELKHLGFSVSTLLLQTATYQDDLTFLQIQEKTDTGQFPETSVLDFFLAVVYPDNTIPLRIEYINASLRDLRGLTEKEYWLSNGAIPTKRQITGDLFQTRKLKESNIKRHSMTQTGFTNKSPGYRILR